MKMDLQISYFCYPICMIFTGGILHEVYFQFGCFSFLGILKYKQFLDTALLLIVVILMISICLYLNHCCRVSPFNSLLLAPVRSGCLPFRNSAKRLTQYRPFLTSEALCLRKNQFLPHSVDANAASGMAVHDDCKLKFMELKTKRSYRFIVYKIEEQQKQVMVEKIGEPGQSHEDLAASLPADECRYAVFDYDFVIVNQILILCVLVFQQGANRPLWFASSQSLTYLDGSLPGDYGFDPLGLSDPEGTGGFIEPRWLAYGEIINGRFAMLGAAGAIAPEILGKAGLIPAETALPWFQTGVIPPAGTYSYWADNYTLFVLEMALMGFTEHRRLQDWYNPGSMGKQYFLGLEKGLAGSR